MPAAGQLRHRVMVQEVTRTPDDSGGFTESWATAATVWAHVRASAGRESVERGALAVTQRWVVTMRHRALSPADRLLWGARVLEIETIEPDAVEQWLTVRCREDRSDGEA